MAALQAHEQSFNPPCSAARKLISLPDNFLRQILAGMDLKSQGQLKKHALKFIQCLPEAMRPSTAVWVEEHFAGASCIKDGQLYLDIALLLHHRSRMQREGMVFMFALGDSSEKGHLDMYNSRYRWS